jgi:hypothetical protein
MVRQIRCELLDAPVADSAPLTRTAKSNVRRALDSFAKSSQSRSTSTQQASAHPEQVDSPESTRNAEQGSAETDDLATSIAEGVIRSENDVDLHISDSRAGGFDSANHQPKVYSFIQSSELPALDSEIPNAGSKVVQPDPQNEPINGTKTRSEDRWVEPVS